MDLKIEINEQEIQEQARITAQKLTTDAVHRHIREYFTARNNWGSKDGFATLKINKIVEEYIASDAFDEACRKIIHEKINGAAEHAITKLLNSRSRKAFFEQVPHT